MRRQPCRSDNRIAHGRNNLDFAYADTSNRTYKTLKGAVQVTCKRGGGTTRKIEKNRTLAHYGKACAKFYVNGSRRATQCHYITK